MRFSLQREVLLKPLAQVVNVVERRHTLPVLANLLAKVHGGQLALTGTDLEVEMVARTGRLGSRFLGKLAGHRLRTNWG